MYSEAVRRGGTLVSVKFDESRADAVQAILDGHDPIDPLGRAVEYRKGGWTRFDPKAPAYRPSESEIERIRSDHV